MGLIHGALHLILAYTFMKFFIWSDNGKMKRSVFWDGRTWRVTTSGELGGGRRDLEVGGGRSMEEQCEPRPY